MSAETVPSNAAFLDFGGSLSRTDGSYNISIGAIGGPKLNIGDKIKITVTDTEGNVADEIHTLTVEDIVENVGIVDLDIIILGVTVSVDVAPSVFNADTTGTGTVTVTVDRDGPVTDETVTFSLSPAVGIGHQSSHKQRRWHLQRNLHLRHNHWACQAHSDSDPSGCFRNGDHNN